MHHVYITANNKDMKHLTVTRFFPGPFEKIRSDTKNCPCFDEMKRSSVDINEDSSRKFSAKK